MKFGYVSDAKKQVFWYDDTSVEKRVNSSQQSVPPVPAAAT
jgi:hypothetical protein